MTRNPKLFSRLFSSFLLLSFSSLLFSQQSNLQTSFLSPVAVHLTGAVADIAETENLSYIKQITRDSRKSLTTFQPNASDLLIQQAEQTKDSSQRQKLEREAVKAYFAEAVLPVRFNRPSDPNAVATNPVTFGIHFGLGF